MAKKLTPNQQEYKKQIKRIKAAIKREQKKGFITTKLEVELLNKPSRITQKFLEALKKITPKFIRNRSQKYIETPVQPVQTEPQRFTMPEPTPQYTYEPSPTEDTSEYQYDDYDYDYYEPSPDINDTFESLAKGLEELPKREEPTPNVVEPVDPYEDVTSYSKAYVDGTAKAIYTLYDNEGNIVTELIRQDGATYVDTATGELIRSKEVAEIIGDLYNAGKTPTYDITDYAIDQLYDQTKYLDKAMGGSMHRMFDTIRERVGAQDFYQSLVESNGYKSAFEELSAMLAAGADYMLAFTKFGASIVNGLPLTDEEKSEIQEVFNEITQMADEIDTE